MRTFLSHPINRVWARYCVLLGVMTFHLMALEARAASQAEQGILDLRDYDFERDGPVQLQGQWRMWWSTLASPYELLDDPSHSIRVPGVWTSLAETENSDVLLPAFGTATLKLEVLLPEGRLPPLSLFARGAFTAFELDVLEAPTGLVIGRLGSGKIGSSEVEIPELSTDSVDLMPARERLVLVWRISNHNHFLAGPRHAPILGRSIDLERDELAGRLRSFGLVGALFIIGLYHLSLFYQRREDRGALWFATFCIIIGVRELLLSRVLTEFMDAPTRAHFDWLYTFQDFTVYFAVSTFLSYTLSLFETPRFRRFTQLIWALSIGYALLALFTPPRVFTFYYNGYLIIIFVAALGGIGHIVRQMFLRRPMSGRVLIGFLPLALTVIWDNLVTMQIVDPPLLASYGVAAFVLIQSTILATRFSTAFAALKSSART